MGDAPGVTAQELLVAVGLPRVPGYVDLVEIGSGGSARVYRAQCLKLRRTVALKVFHDASGRARHEADCEVEVSAQVGAHPGIVAVLDRGTLADGRCWIALEHHRISLADRAVARGAMAPDEVAGLGMSLCRSLDALHRSGVRHGDLSLANVMVSEFGDPIIIDFGCATAVGVAPHHNDVRRGTRGYLAPEHRNGGPATIAGDLFALAMVLRKAGGDGPSAGPDDEPATDAVMATTGEAVAPGHAGLAEAGGAGLDAALVGWVAASEDPLSQLIESLLADDPLDRPSSAQWVGERLAMIVDGGSATSTGSSGGNEMRRNSPASLPGGPVVAAAMAATSACSLVASVLALVSLA